MSGVAGGVGAMPDRRVAFGRRSMRGQRARLVALAVVCCVALATAACLPSAPSGGRPGPVKRVLVLGDSFTYGLFGTTPQLHGPLGRMLADRGIGLHVTGFAGETPVDTWAGHLSWGLRMRHEVTTWNPDVVIIQSTLFPDPDSPARRAAYSAATADLIAVARSRGAHVYLVAHPGSPRATERRERDVAQALQARAAAGKGISTIPLDWWMGRCEGGTVADGWHLSAKGQNCHALAFASAVDQLRSAVG